MCTKCGDNSISVSPDLARRQFLKLAGAATLALGFLGKARAAEVGAPPKPQNVIGPDEALNRLKEGNRRYVEGKTQRLDFAAERPILAGSKSVCGNSRMRRFASWSGIRL